MICRIHNIHFYHYADLIGSTIWWERYDKTEYIRVFRHNGSLIMGENSVETFQEATVYIYDRFIQHS